MLTSQQFEEAFDNVDRETLLKFYIDNKLFLEKIQDYINVVYYENLYLVNEFKKYLDGKQE